MFILHCACGNELYCSNEESCNAWKCEKCGNWYDMFGYPVQKSVEENMPQNMTCMVQEDF